MSTPAAPAPQETAPVGPAADASRADQDLAELDRLLGELDGQLKKAEETPNDED